MVVSATGPFPILVPMESVNRTVSLLNTTSRKSGFGATRNGITLAPSPHSRPRTEWSSTPTISGGKSFMTKRSRFAKTRSVSVRGYSHFPPTVANDRIRRTARANTRARAALTVGAFHFSSKTSARRFTVIDGDKSDKSPGAA